MSKYNMRLFLSQRRKIVSSIDQAYQTKLQNIQKKPGKSLDELTALIQNSGLAKHSEIRDMLKRDLALGNGDANTLVHFVLKSDGERAAQEKGMSTEDVLTKFTRSPKPICVPFTTDDFVMAAKTDRLGIATG